MHKLDSQLQHFRHQYIDLVSACIHTASLWVNQQQANQVPFELTSSPIHSQHSRAVVTYRGGFFGLSQQTDKYDVTPAERSILKPRS